MWLSRRSAAGRSLDDAAAERLGRLARQWRPIPPGAASTSRVAGEDDDAVGADRPDPWRAVMASERSTHLLMRPWNAPATRALVVLVATCLAVTVWWWWSGRPHEVVPTPSVLATGRPITPLRSDPTAATDIVAVGTSQVVVHVAGHVAHPGLVTLPAGSRVADAVAAAGGVTRRRAAETVNLARVLVDGEQIVVGSEPSATAVGAAPATPAPSALDLNAADGAAFEGLPGVGPVLAARIVEWRVVNGPFRSVDELGEVAGIGDATVARLRPLVRV